MSRPNSLPTRDQVEELFADPAVRERTEDIFQEVFEWITDLWSGGPPTDNQRKEAIAIMMILQGKTAAEYRQELLAEDVS